MISDESIKNLCCGCGTCSLGCPQKCIQMIMDDEGFYKPVIDRKNCIECGRCKSLCPMLKQSKNEIINTYAMASKNSEIYERSSSGGFFSHIAKIILERNGIVWGCGYINNKAVHMSVSQIEELDNLRRSKYVQSNLGETFNIIKSQLVEKKEVLFVGTPCQVAALNNYLNCNYENLLTIDIVCHGVPSPGFFEKHVEYLEEKHGKKIKRFEFRLKNRNYRSYAFTYIFNDNSKKSDAYYKDVFFNEFYDMTSLNECCYKCPFACESRQGDITIGDFQWGKKHHKEFEEQDDISCVIVNTEKGMSYIKCIDNVILIPTKLQYIEEKNLNLIRPTVRPQYRDYIFKDMSKGYTKWADSYFRSWRYIKKKPLIMPLLKLKARINLLRNKV